MHFTCVMYLSVLVWLSENTSTYVCVYVCVVVCVCVCVIVCVCVCVCVCERERERRERVVRVEIEGCVCCVVLYTLCCVAYLYTVFDCFVRICVHVRVYAYISIYVVLRCILIHCI